MARHTRNTGKVNLTDNSPVDKGFVSALFGNTDFLLVDRPQREEHCLQKSPKIPLERSFPHTQSRFKVLKFRPFCDGLQVLN